MKTKIFVIALLAVFAVSIASPPPAEAIAFLAPVAAVVAWAVALAGGSIIAASDPASDETQVTVETDNRSTPSETIQTSRLASEDLHAGVVIVNEGSR